MKEILTGATLGAYAAMFGVRGWAHWDLDYWLITIGLCAFVLAVWAVDTNGSLR